jgi:threonine/homoserine/homoserine lactone efflux protein
LLDALFFLKGFAIGFSIAAPIGPIGLLCIQRTIANGRSTGMMTGLGTASADALYATLGASGLAIAAALLADVQPELRLVGGSFLVYLGLRIALRKGSDPKDAAKTNQGLMGAYLSSLGLTLANPLTIISFAAIFAGLGLVGREADAAGAATLVLGVFGGSVTWWVILSSSVNLFRGTFSSGRMRLLNLLSGTLIVGFGTFAIMSLL